MICYYHDDLDGRAAAFCVHAWDGINAKRGYSWDSNPWVWVVEFKVIP